MLHPGVHPFLIAERQLACIITNTFLRLFFMMKLLAESENAVIIGADIFKFRFLRIQLLASLYLYLAALALAILPCFLRTFKL